MRVIRVAKAQKAQGTCRCGHEILAGESYKWAKGRHTPRMVRCQKCEFRQSDLTSGKMANVYSAQENAEDTVEGWDGDDVEEIRSALEDMASEIESVADEYRESADAIREHFSESSTADECEEKADGLEGWKDDISDAACELEEYAPEAEEPEEPEEPVEPVEPARPGEPTINEATGEATGEDSAAYAAAITDYNDAYAAWLTAHDAWEEAHDAWETAHDAWEESHQAWEEAQEEAKSAWADEIREAANEVIGACPV